MATRDIPFTADKLAEEVLRPVWYVEIEFSTGTVRYWSGVGPKSYNGYTWTGTGELGTISPLGETSDLRADGIRLQLVGIPSAEMALVLGSLESGKPATVYFGLQNATGALYSGLITSYQGLVDTAEIIDTPDGASIVVTIENRLIILDKSVSDKYTHERQIEKYPSDLGLEYVLASTRGTQTFTIPYRPGNHGKPKYTM